MLVYFKYNLYSEIVLMKYSTNLRSAIPVPPAGISFFTFQSLSYTIDVYEGGN
ncbi:MAG: hypothetical protein IPH31_05405 [Lewinellaceae bacterium]|nr:hypothetical protein [Lewinellaceae bacterium]